MLPFKEAQKRLDPATLIDLKNKWTDAVGDTKKECNFKQFCKMVESDTMGKDECKALFQVYDVSKNGLLSWHEFICAVALVTRGSFDEKIALVFHSFDANGDGKVSKDELARAVKVFSSEGADFVTKVFITCDKNGDGSISLEEFSDWVKNDPESYASVCSKLNIEF